MAKFIVFSGLDGSGKSTQIDLIKKNYLKNKKKCFVFWSRGGYTPGFQNLKNIIRFFLGKKLKKPGFTPQRKKAFSNPLFRKLWLTISILDLIFYYSFYLRVKKLFGYNIICDRYLLDTEIDFNLAFPKENIENWFMWRFLQITSLIPDYHFIFVISVKESIKRSLIKKEPFSDSPNILKNRLEKYIEHSKHDNKSHLISCDKTINFINKKILSKLKF